MTDLPPDLASIPSRLGTRFAVDERGELSGVLAVHPGMCDRGVVPAYALLFLAFWLSWTGFMLYGNIRADDARAVQLLVGMFGIGVMSAAIPGVAHVLVGDGHDHVWLRVFALAYFLVRVSAARTFDHALVIDFPVVQQTFGAVPWLVSAFVHSPTVVVALWVIGIGIDVLGVIGMSSEEVQVRSEQRFAAMEHRMARHPDNESPRARARLASFRPRPVTVAVDHLSERLGLFVIIALGEGVVQVVGAASEQESGHRVLLAGLAAFLLLASLFGLSVFYGHAGVPHLHEGRLVLRFVFGLHAMVTAVLAALAVSLVGVVEHRTEPLADGQRWLLCGGVAAYFALGYVGAVATRGLHLRSSLLWLGSGVVVPVLVGALGADLAAVWVAVLMVVVVLPHVLLERRASRARLAA